MEWPFLPWIIPSFILPRKAGGTLVNMQKTEKRTFSKK
jgi:hypothetical protein